MLTRWVTEQAGGGAKSLARPHPHGPRIAVIGAGPAGLAAAHDLTVLGARVSLFDRVPEPGGLLTSCIPSFRLPEETIREDIDRILSMGIDFQRCVSFNNIDEVAALLSDGYAAAVLAVGAGDDKVPQIPGWRDDPATVTAIDFLTSFRNGGFKLGGSRVIVIGGGNAALDAARASLRAGAREVKILYRRDWSDMSALPDEIREAKAEGILFHTLTLPVEVVWREDRVSGVRVINTRVNGAGLDGRREVLVVSGTQHFQSADMIVAAIGQAHPLQQSLGPEIEGDRTRTMIAPGVFACGDFITGPSTVAEAIASGRRAAAAIRARLAATNIWDVADGHFEHLIDKSIPSLSIHPSTHTSATELSVSSAAALADSCLRCDYHLKLHTDRCVLCGECVVRCAQDSLRWSRDPERETFALLVNDSSCTRCGDCVSACPVGAIHWSLWTRRNQNIELQAIARA